MYAFLQSVACVCCHQDFGCSPVKNRIMINKGVSDCTIIEDLLYVVVAEALSAFLILMKSLSACLDKLILLTKSFE